MRFALYKSKVARPRCASYKVFLMYFQERSNYTSANYFPEIVIHIAAKFAQNYPCLENVQLLSYISPHIYDYSITAAQFK